MQTVVEDVVADAQCGFELGCDCRSHHDNMEAEVSVTGELARIQISIGLRQGCVLAVTLFYCIIVMQCWRDRCEGLRVKLPYMCGRKLVVERNNSPRSSLVTERSFADDAIITVSTREDITKATMELKQVTTEYGLTISFPKTKLLAVGTGITDTDHDLASLSIGSRVIESVYTIL